MNKIKPMKTMKKIITTIIFLLAIGTFSFAQENVEFKGSNFKDNKDEYKEAMDQMDLGDEEFEKGFQAIFSSQDPTDFFRKAMVHYKVPQELNPNNANLNYKIGVCKIYTADKQNSIPYIKKAQKLDAECSDFIDYFMGYALQLEGEFNDAKTFYKKFSINYKKADDFARYVKQREMECDNLKKAIDNPERVWVDNVQDVNTKYDEFAPSITTDGGSMVFTSDRENGREPNEYGVYDQDIYKTYFDNGSWSKPLAMKGNINSPADDISCNLSYDGNRMLLSREQNGYFHLYESVKNGGTWGALNEFPSSINMKGGNIKFGAYSFDNLRIYFGKIIDGSKSGFDMYFCKAMDPTQYKYGGPSPAGTFLNSQFHDGPMYLTPDGKTIYFSSEGHNSLGGYDIYMSKNIQGQWSKPVNLGYPINTQYDDMFFAATANKKFAYISSNREGGSGGFDIYKVTFWGPEKQLVVDVEDYLLAGVAQPIADNQMEGSVEVNNTSLTVFKGKTIDALTRKPVATKIDIIDNGTGSVIKTIETDDQRGKFLMSLVAGKNYGIAVKADGYLFHSENFDIPDGSDYNLVNKVVELKNIAVGSKIALRNIFFATGKADLRSESYTELDRLVKLLNDVPSLEVEISGHTDNTGSAVINEELSRDRAKAVVDYLVSKGIKKGRLTSAGYGSSQPIASNASAEGRQQNRRTEFKILKN